MANHTTDTPHTRETFYVGGQYVQDEQGKHTLQGQMYVERLRPADTEEGSVPKKQIPLLFIHGGTRTGYDWTTKPDGSPGWASYFLSHGYEAYLVDLPFRGRSPWFPGNGTQVAYPAETIEQMFTATKHHARWPQAQSHTQWPGTTGRMGDPIFDGFYASAIQQVASLELQESAAQAACVALVDRIGRPVAVLAHSAGGSLPYLIADKRPGLVEMIVGLEPTGPPFHKVTLKHYPGAPYGLSYAPITFDPPVQDPDVDLVRRHVKAPGAGLLDGILQALDPPPRQLVNLRDIPILVVTAPASYHAQYDWCSVEFLRQAGASVEHMKLEERGIFGNGHMFFMEKNSDQVAGEIQKWIESTAKKGAGKSSASTEAR